MPDNRLLIRRAVVLDGATAGRVSAWLEDNFHHFGVAVKHDGRNIIDIDATAVRYPWTSCPGAGEVLGRLVGEPLSSRPERLATHVRMELHCTHMFELAALAMAHALREAQFRRYDLAIYSTTPDAGQLAGTLSHDGAPVLSVEVANDVVTTPANYAGRHLYKGFRSWLDELPDEDAERLWMIRRGFWLARGLELFRPKPVAGDSQLGPVCHTYQPERRDTAYSMPNSRIDMLDETMPALLSAHPPRRIP